jgi:hypothetical protein
VRQVAHELEVLGAGEVLVDGGELAGEPDALADGLGIAADVDVHDLGDAGVGAEDRGEDAHGDRLAGTVGPEQPEDGVGRHGQVDAGQRPDGTEGLGDALGPDGGVVHGRHPVPYR